MKPNDKARESGIQMRRIAVTGGIASGKTTLMDALRVLGARVIDADEASRALTARDGLALPRLREVFGEAFFKDNGQLNRAALAEAVFSDASLLERLNAVMFPLIKQEIDRRMKALASAGETLVFLEAPLLYEAGMEEMYDEVWCVYLPKRVQIKRLMARDGLTRSQALRRIESQMPLLYKARRADKVIRTDGDPAGSISAITALYETAREKRP